MCLLVLLSPLFLFHSFFLIVSVSVSVSVSFLLDSASSGAMADADMRDAVAALPPSSYDEEAIFKAAETGSAADEQLFLALSSTPHLLRQACSLRNQDSRSALHVAAASGHAQVLPSFLLLVVIQTHILRGSQAHI